MPPARAGARQDSDPADKAQLEPVDAGRLPPQIQFRIFSFEIGIDQVPALRKGFSQIGAGQLHFADGRAFQANGFLAACGTGDNVARISMLLDRVQARRTETRNLVVYDDAGDDISTTMLNLRQEVTWKRSDGKIAKDVFSPGRFAWMLKAAPVPDIRGVTQVRMLPVYRIGVDNFLTYLARLRSYAPFDFAAFDMQMNPGDFILLGSLGEPDADGTVGGDGVASGDRPEEQADSTGADTPPQPLTLNRLLFQPPEKPWVVNLYLIVCVRVGD